MQYPDSSNIITSVLPIVREGANLIEGYESNIEIIKPSHKDRGNITRGIDIRMQHYYADKLEILFANHLLIIGEEKETAVNWEKEQRLSASVDPVDGTDLFAKGMFNWCTTLFFFIPNEHIAASLMGVPSTEMTIIPSGQMLREPASTVYYASEAGAFKNGIIKQENESKESKIDRVKLEISDENKMRKLKDASICFYGQKASNLLSMTKKDDFITFLKKIEEETKEAKKSKEDPPSFRIYNLGGNPMMVKLADGDINAVLELKGQALYDCVPGAFIAQKAGAYWGDLEGRLIDDAYIKDLLKDPEENKLSYILASSKDLYTEILSVISA